VVDPDPQAAKRTAIPTLVIDFRALFIAPTSFEAPLARGCTARAIPIALFISPLGAPPIVF
jgi:hypothetical protein